jgi:hypothetical protein
MLEVAFDRSELLIKCTGVPTIASSHLPGNTRPDLLGKLCQAAPKLSRLLHLLFPKLAFDPEPLKRLSLQKIPR